MVDQPLCFHEGHIRAAARSCPANEEVWELHFRILLPRCGPWTWAWAGNAESQAPPQNFKLSDVWGTFSEPNTQSEVFEAEDLVCGQRPQFSRPQLLATIWMPHVMERDSEGTYKPGCGHGCTCACKMQKHAPGDGSSLNNHRYSHPMW